MLRYNKKGIPIYCICQECEVPFEVNVKRSKFCSQKCRTKNNRKTN